MTLTVEAAPAVKFNILGVGALKSSSSDDGKMRLHGIASSTMKDRHGDTIAESAIDDMVRSASDNMTIFLNHSYTIPEDIGGSVESVNKRFDGIDALLALTILIDETNPRAVQTWKSVQAGRQVGISIGANLPEGGYTRNKDGTYLINHLDLLEASLVGVPANPKSWVEYAVKALNDSNTTVVFDVGERDGPEWVSLGAVCPSCGGGKSSPHGGCGSDYHNKAVEPVVVAESHPELPDSAFACVDSTGRHYPHHTASGSLNLNLLRNALARIADSGNTQCGKGHLEAHARKAGIGDRKSADELLALTDDELIDLSAAMGSDAHEHDEPHIHDEAPSSETKAVVDIHIDTDNSEESGVSVASPDAQASTPGAEAGLQDEDADGTDALLGDTVTASAEPVIAAGHYSLPAGEMASLVDSYAHVVKDLMDSRVALAEVTAANTKLTSERDAALRDRERIITETGALLTRLSEIPLVRKTSVAAAYTDFRARFSGVYDEDFLDMLEKKRNA